MIIKRPEMKKISWLAWVLISVSGLPACGKNFHPASPNDISFQARAQRQCEKKICVTVAVPSPNETKRIFGVPLEAKGMQPIWVKVENNEKEDFYLLPGSIDPEYFSPNEVAYKFRLGFKGAGRKEMARYFNKISLDPYVAPGETSSGFEFTHLDRDRKEVSTVLISDKELRQFSFIIPVPGFKADYHEVDFDTLYSKEEITNYQNLKDLRHALEQFPCCTTKKGAPKGDAVNLVVIGEDEDVYPAFVRAGWRETEAKNKGTALRTLKAYLSRREYKYAPMSDLYLLGRKQDMGLQKPRETPHERNHLRLWLAPITFKGKPVWVGTISRDIGIMWTVKSPYLFITHKIDPDIDETREYLLQDLLGVQAVEAAGWVKGVGPVSIDNPRKDPMGNPYFTDGLRIVIFVSHKSVDIDEVDFLDWEEPPPPQR